MRMGETDAEKTLLARIAELEERLAAMRMVAIIAYGEMDAMRHVTTPGDHDCGAPRRDQEDEKMNETESKLQAAILSALWAIGVLAWSVKMGARGRVSLGVISKRHQTGFPDILMCVGGRFCAIEVKLPGGEDRGSKKRLAAQLMCRQDIVDHGGVAIVATSVSDVLDIVIEIRRGRMN